MKNRITDANFPRTGDGRVYHLGLRQGEVANRIVTVGDPSRARRISKFLDASPEPFVLQSERGFLTITGKYSGTPISIIAIGMGIGNMDFFVRECRESLDGDMAIIRLGSCGSLVPELPVGSLSLPKACVGITRNYDYDFTAATTESSTYRSSNPPYSISRLVEGHQPLQLHLKEVTEATRPEGASDAAVRADFVNASADSFYSSQGRQTSFPDHNEGLVSELLERVPGVATLEMETHHLFHLAAVYPKPPSELPLKSTASRPVLTRPEGEISATGSAPKSETEQEHSRASRGAIYATAIQMIFAQRQSQDFITPEEVVLRENWAGKACLEALVKFNVQSTQPDEGSVWAKL
ncbi:hypothetical protein M407DRAFT_246975 [Tulasnella calospora MUT 4182]|uniref:Nucleoside phosphorylase domain-containing protein n=1 Tax=Tulasnella calospora MUT 4182 TaxID=1051891 RepID=A0A0C3K4Y7_9AGAM|nr:hypothetical protein M407DRAFT_246975 [Tulasnella calospora MUT 4182]